jgi:hypothetical protein
MIYQILNGDGLAGNFDFAGEQIICRECLIEGDLKTESLEHFWQVRADFFSKSFGENSYFEKVKTEFDKLKKITADDEVNLWFGHDAFCQVNMWFVLSRLEKTKAKFYRIFPDSDGWNCGFNNLQKCLESGQELTNSDLQLGRQLWKAFCFRDFENLKQLGAANSPCFIRLDEVCRALIEIDSKPKRILSEIIQKGEIDFGEIFSQFKAKAGVYGFGDLQVRNILKTW